MKQTKLIVYGFIVIMLAACSSEETALKALEDNEIKLTTRVEGMLKTRVGIDDYQMNTQLVSGRKLDVYIVDHETRKGVQGTTTYYNDDGYASYTVGENGSLTSTSKPQYPAGSTVDIYALHGTTMGMNSDQELNGASASTIDEVNKRDVMYALATNQSNSGSPIVLTFHHVMSKINLSIDPGNTGNVVEGATIKTLFYPCGVFTSNDMTNGLKVAVKDNSGHSYDECSWGTYVSGGVTGIIVPQIRYPSATYPMFTIELTDGSKYYYNPSSSITFESGKEYTFNLTLVDNYSATATTSITEWDDSSSIKDVNLE